MEGDNQKQRSVGYMNERLKKEAQPDFYDLEIIPDCKYGYIARYKNLTADGKTPDEAMTNLAEVILLAFSPNGPLNALLEQMGEALKAILRGLCQNQEAGIAYC